MKNKLRAAKILAAIGLALVLYTYSEKGKIMGGEEVSLFILGLILLVGGVFGVATENNV